MLSGIASILFRTKRVKINNVAKQMRGYKTQEKERRKCLNCQHGFGKDVVLCSAPHNGCRDTQHPT
jgi:hypothetical protein